MEFIIGGRMGDLIHSLWVVKNTRGNHDLFITDRRDLHSDGFVFSLDQTIKELSPILLSQPNIISLQVYNNETATNLNLWRQYAYSTHWVQLLAKTYALEPNGEIWLRVGKTAIDFFDKIVIHCSIHEARRGHHWQVVMDKYEGQCVFVGQEDEYKAFGFKVPFYQPKDLSEHFNIINSCKFFIGNQSAPLAIAHALGVPRLAMLNEVDKAHYVGEEKFFSNFYWMAKETYYFEGLNY